MNYPEDFTHEDIQEFQEEYNRILDEEYGSEPRPFEFDIEPSFNQLFEFDDIPF